MSGYLKALEDMDTVEADARIENVLEFRSVAAEFQKTLESGGLDDYEEEMAEERESLRAEGFSIDEPSELSAFLEKITLMADIDNRDENEDAVVLMTLHSAKGLEFPVVFMPGDGKWNFSRSCVSGEQGQAGGRKAPLLRGNHESQEETLSD